LRASYLSLTGYRLPTEVEMEYAIRAGADTARYYGETEELLPKYARYQINTNSMPSPVGSLKPNDLGLFDVQGNVWTWCQEAYKHYAAGNGDVTADDREDGQAINSTVARVLRGSSFHERDTSWFRSAVRYNVAPTMNGYNFGVRVARTFIP